MELLKWVSAKVSCFTKFFEFPIQSQCFSAENYVRLRRMKLKAIKGKSEFKGKVKTVSGKGMSKFSSIMSLFQL